MPQPQAPAAPPAQGTASQTDNSSQDFAKTLQDLNNQLQAIQSRRSALIEQVKGLSSEAPTRPMLEVRIAELDRPLALLDALMASNAALGAQGIGEPTVATTAMPPEFYHDRALPKDVFALAAVFMVVLLLPLSLAISKRILRRRVPAAPELSSEVMDRLGRMEAIVESTAVEVERIGEGQRYLTRVLSERTMDKQPDLPRITPRESLAPRS